MIATMIASKTMCKCTPNMRTPWCGNLGCEEPERESENKESGVFGKNLKEVLDFLGMTQSELADRSGLTRAAISQIIGGQRDPSLSSVIAILSVVPVKFERLIR